MEQTLPQFVSQVLGVASLEEPPAEPNAVCAHGKNGQNQCSHFMQYRSLPTLRLEKFYFLLG